jgi:hypothetical protein
MSLRCCMLLQIGGNGGAAVVLGELEVLGLASFKDNAAKV